MSEARTATFWRLMKRGYALIQRSRFEAALRSFEDARDLAAAKGDPKLTDKAIGNRSMALIELGRYEEAAKGLREIILRSQDDETICGAAYNLSISLRRQGQYAKACFYARLSGEKSRALGDPKWLARCHNLLGNLHLVQSRLEAALKEYRKALRIRMQEPVLDKFGIAYLRDNIGYCLLLLGRYDGGTREILEALKLAEEVGNVRCVCECSHDLAFGLMQMRRLQEAEVFGEKALALAKSLGSKEIVNNCYYILGEINHLLGNEARRDEFFSLLQTLHPNVPHLREFLCTFDVSKIIALRFPQ